jgi:PAS domain S-box-containing protein
MDANNSLETQDFLREWRTRILNGFLAVAAFACVPIVAMTFFNATSQNGQWGAVAIFTVLLVLLAVLALWRRLDYRIRAWGVLLLGYAAGTVSLLRGGLAGTGRDFLLVMPLVGLILIGVRAGIFSAILSAVLLALFALLAEKGVLNPYLVMTDNSTRLSDWITEGSGTLMLLGITLALLVLFHRFQVKLIENERKTHDRLMKAQALIEAANENLEQKVQERTSELASATRHAEALAAAAVRADREKDAALAETRTVLDAIDYGILLLGSDLHVHIGNRALREMWQLPAEIITEGATLADLINFNRHTGLYPVPDDQWEAYVQSRVSAIAAGEIPPTQFHRGDGRILRYQAKVLPDGGRMLTYFDITDLVHQSEYLAALNETTVGLISRLDVTDLLENLLTRAGQLLNAPHGYLYLLDPGEAEMECKVGVGALSEMVGSRRKPGQGMTGQIWNSGEPLVVDDYSTWSGRVESNVQNVARAIMGVPLKSGDRVVGVIGLAYGMDSHQVFGADQVSILSRFAQLASVALDNARLFETEQRRSEQFQVISEVGYRISSILMVDELLKQIARLLKEKLGYYLVGIALIEGDELVFKSGAGAVWEDPGFKPPRLKVGEEGITGWVAQNGQPLLVRDLSQEARYFSLPEASEMKSELAVPLIAKEEVIGVLHVQSPHLNAFDESDLVLLQSLAHQAAIAIENARLYDQAQREITERKLAESELRASEEKLRLIFENAFDGISIYEEFPDEDRRILLDCNERYCQIAGRSKEELLSMGDTRLVQVSLENAPEIEDAANVKIGRAFSGVFSWRRPDRKENIIEYSAAPTQVGNRYFTIGLDREITERQKVQEQLRQAMQTAEAATQAKSAFLATMSHEIRTPMNAIIGMSGLLFNTKLDETQKEFTEIIRTSGDVLLTIINDILDFSKIEAGKLELEATPFNLRACLESAIDLLATRTAENELDLGLEVAPGVPDAITGDVTRLRQVLVNLLNNAVKFTEHGEVQVKVEVVEPQGTPLFLHFAVKDTGIGISPEGIERLFQSFSQVDTSTSRRYGGTGLGLVICKRLVELMGGKIWVESQMEVGSTFHFTIAAEPAQVEVRSHFQGEQPHLAGKRLLVVDDNATNRRILNLQTKEWGMITRETGSPLQALAWIRQDESFDLGILDLHMPEMDGVNLAREIHKLRDAQTLPLIILSSFGSHDPEVDSVDWAAFLTKPLKQSQLYQVLSGIFAPHEGQSLPKAQPAGEKVLVDPHLAERCPLSILLAEDNVFNQKLALHLLGQMGYQADLVANGLEAVQAVDRQAYEVILMDVQMPMMDGLEATRQIRLLQARQTRPYIIATTANALQGDAEICMQAGMDDYLSKPIHIQELAAALERAAGVQHE